MERLGIDVGGSGIKGALVDTREGKFISERKRIPTPSSKRPDEVLDVVCEVVAHFDGYQGPVGIGFPAVVVDGVPRTPFTAHHVEGWVGLPVAEKLSERLGRPVTMLNDADAAGVAETRFGHGRDENGVVIVLTLGTGIGGALFVDGRLVPNVEFGQLYLRNQEERAERYAAAGVRKREGLKWKAYARRLDQYLRHIDYIFSPHLIVIGGGVSKKHEKFFPHLTVEARIVPAALRNRAGIIGAATAVAEGWPNDSR